MSAMARPAAAARIAVRTAMADGVKLQYLTASTAITGGAGPAIVLLHGYAETSRMWKPTIENSSANAFSFPTARTSLPMPMTSAFGSPPI